jgi:hypothetical protein
MREPGKHIDLSPRAVFKRLIRWGTAALVLLLLLIGLFYGVENVRGYRAWKKYKAQLQAKGEQLEWSSYVPKSVPDEQNFTQTPLLQAATQKNYASQPVWRGFGSRTHFGSYLGNWMAGSRTDLESCQEKIEGATAGTAAQAVLDAFQELEPALAELRAAAQRPYAQFAVPLTKPWEGSVPNFAAIRQLVQLLSVHACAELAANHPEKALEDILTLHKIADALRSQPTLVSAMIRVAILGGPATQPIWEGIISGKWSDAQLSDFQKLYAGIDLFTDLRQAFRGGERAAVNELIDKNPAELRKMFVDSGDSKGSARSWKDRARDFVNLAPSGWRYQNQLFYNRVIQDYVLDPIDPAKGPISPELIKEGGRNFERDLGKAKVFGVVAAMAVPNYQKAMVTAARNQTGFQELQIACALERYRRKATGYPERLDHLKPGFMGMIQIDPIAGNSMHYERIDATHFTLYSPGWDGKDDGGTVASSRERGDWVWFSEARR